MCTNNVDEERQLQGFALNKVGLKRAKKNALSEVERELGGVMVRALSRHRLLSPLYGVGTRRESPVPGAPTIISGQPGMVGYRVGRLGHGLL